MPRPVRLFALLLAGLLLATPVPPPLAARPALWVVRDADTEIWLFGSVHALPPRLDWLTGAVRAAFTGSDTLVLETLVPANSAAIFAELSLSDGAPEPWAQVIERQGTRLAALGYRSVHGVEARLRGEAGGKRAVALEDFRAQLARIDAIPLAAQRAWLARSGDGDPARIVALWRAGDAEGLAALVNGEAAADPVLAAALIDRPNRAWAAWVARRMRQPGRVFVAVGAGHLAGRGNMVDRLRAAGLRVERVQ